MGSRGHCGTLPIFVIYRDPSDYPGKYVLRRQLVSGGVITVDPEPMAVGDTLMHARAQLPMGLHRMERHQDDEPQIVECWL